MALASSAPKNKNYLRAQKEQSEAMGLVHNKNKKLFLPLQ